MIKTRCFRCGNAFTLAEQTVANALAAEGVTEKPTHYTVECPHCRRMNKVSLKGVHLPDPQTAGESPTEE
jgi:hypothetical protein